MATVSQPPQTPPSQPPPPPGTTVPQTSPQLVPSRQPLPLSASQEGQVREIYHKRVRNKCAEEVRLFAACATNRTFTAPFYCRPERRQMNACMLQYANQAEQDAAREEWFATRDLRRKEREAKEEKRKEQEKFHREWWGLDEHGNRVEKKQDK
ncbi:hypothetical protein E4T48_08057 [Aureobasidium sp. EXF-10727]|nr:hypothetical protein E4T48_08057 [Aureobasidium sp. EXF-10727]